MLFPVVYSVGKRVVKPAFLLLFAAACAAVSGIALLLGLVGVGHGGPLTSENVPSSDKLLVLIFIVLPACVSEEESLLVGGSEPDQPSHLVRLVGRVQATDEGSAGGRRGETGQDSEQSRFAGAVGTHHRQDLAGLDIQ